MFSQNRIMQLKTCRGVKNTHLRNLVVLLRDLLFAHDFNGAGQVLTVLLYQPLPFRELIVKVLTH
jgi:hypothetical protein